MTITTRDDAALPTDAVPRRSAPPGILPGLALTAGIAALGIAIHDIPGFSAASPTILAILIGIAFRNTIGLPVRAKPGVTFGLRRVLRFAIILLGLQLTAAQVAEVGARGVGIIVLTLVATFIVTKALGRLFGVDRKLAELIAAGTSICGASAVIATNTVTEASDEDVAYAVACVTVFGSLSIVLYPLLPGLLHLGPRAFGLWAGASIHEIAQVVAAAYQDGRTAGDFGTIAKLSRVILLAPVIVSLSLLAMRRRRARHHGPGAVRVKAPMPYFVLGFVALVGLNSIVAIPAAPKTAIVQVTGFLLALSLAAMGLETDIAKLRAKGLRPLALGAAAWIFIAGFSLALVKLFA
jgi:uncharacterized integral membrane protein (TIGR00698 family)